MMIPAFTITCFNMRKAKEVMTIKKDLEKIQRFDLRSDDQNFGLTFNYKTLCRHDLKVAVLF